MPETYEFYIFHRSKPQPLYCKIFKRDAAESQREPRSITAIIDTFSRCLETFGQSAEARDVRAITTDHYKLHHFDTPTGLRLVLLTDPTVLTPAGNSVLLDIYRSAYVELVAKRPDYSVKDADPIVSELFDAAVARILHKARLL